MGNFRKRNDGAIQGNKNKSSNLQGKVRKSDGVIMSDYREYLESACVAAGLGRYILIDGYGYTKKPGEKAIRWNPLNDDGDALRLAVKLGILLDFVYRNQVWAYSNGDGWLHEFFNDDPYAATRRAIVRAAAEIGRAI